MQPFIYLPAISIPSLVKRQFSSFICWAVYFHTGFWQFIIYFRQNSFVMCALQNIVSQSVVCIFMKSFLILMISINYFAQFLIRGKLLYNVVCSVGFCHIVM